MVILEGSGGGIVDVPDVSAAWYVDVVEAVAAAPALVQAGLGLLPAVLLLALLMVVATAWWSARRREAATMAGVLAVPLVATVAYVASEVLKSVMSVDRPCRLVGGVTPLEACPEFGDWSFPSNHATVAAAIGVALCGAGARFGVVGVLLAVAEACSRVLVGAHFPHDVAVGLVLGGSVAVLAPLAARAVRPVVVRARGSRAWRAVADRPAAAAALTVPLALRR